jgi:hypothetical protein
VVQFDCHPGASALCAAKAWPERSRRRSGRAVRSVASFATQYRTLGSLPCQTAAIPRFWWVVQFDCHPGASAPCAAKAGPERSRRRSGRAVRSVASFAMQYRTLGSPPCQTAAIPRLCMLCNLSVLCATTSKSAKDGLRCLISVPETKPSGSGPRTSRAFANRYGTRQAGDYDDDERKPNAKCA